jgi:hypothetical protein
VEDQARRQGGDRFTKSRRTEGSGGQPLNHGWTIALACSLHNPDAVRSVFRLLVDRGDYGRGRVGKTIERLFYARVEAAPGWQGWKLEKDEG